MKFWPLLVALCSPCYADTQVVVIFSAITSGNTVYDSAFLVVDEREMFTSLRGGVLYKVKGVFDVAPVDGSCVHVEEEYVCTARTGADVFRIIVSSVTRRGTIQPLAGDFTDKSVRSLNVINTGPVSTAY